MERTEDVIEFNGVLDGKCKKYLIKKQIKFQLFVSVLCTIIFIIPVVFVPPQSLVSQLILISVLGLNFFSIIPPSKNSQKQFMPIKIFIDLQEKTIVHQTEKVERFHMITDVKKVIDYCDWYDLRFSFSGRDLYFVCQKNLISKGTLEDFEALFEGKIVRKTK